MLRKGPSDSSENQRMAPVRLDSGLSAVPVTQSFLINVSGLVRGFVRFVSRELPYLG
jgi:hypothetical protein